MTKTGFARPTALLVAAHLVLAAAWTIVVPSFEKPDEPGHFEYARFLVQEHRLPRPLPAAPWAECAWEFHHPPLYHLVAGLTLAAVDPDLAPLLRTDRLANTFYGDLPAARRAAATPDLPRLNIHGPLFGGGDAGFFVRDPRDRVPWQPPYRALHLLRLLGLAFSTVVVMATARAAVLVLGEGPWAVSATALVALNPQFLFLAGSVSNDGLAAMLGALVTLLGLRVALRPATARAVFGLGLAVGLALLTRMTLLALVPFAVVCAWYSSARKPGSRVVLLVVVTIGIAGWWFVRNTLVYGDPLAARVVLLANGGIPHPRSLRDPFFWAPIEGGLVSRTFQSYWGFFGWMSLPQSRRIAAQLALLCLAGGTGTIAWWTALRRARGQQAIRNRRTLGLLALNLAAAIALVVQLNRTYDSPQGRYLFGSLIPIAILVVAGCRYWASRLNFHIAGVATAWAAPTYLIAINLVDLIRLTRIYGISTTG